MESDVYVDILFLINFSMDYLCLYICSRVLHRPIRLWRMLLASGMGGLYSVVSLFIGLPSPLSLLADLSVCVIMCITVYFERGRKFGSFFVSCFLYIGISMMTGGCMTAIFNLFDRLDLPIDAIEADGLSTYAFAILAAVAGFISLKSGQIISKKGSVKECKLLVRFCGKELEFSGFADSGNFVREPISGKAVIFLDRAVIERVQSLDFLDRYANGKADPDSPCKRLYLFSLHTAHGVSLAVAAQPESIRIEFAGSKNTPRNLELDALISPIDLSKSARGYTAIIPSEIMKE